MGKKKAPIRQKDWRLDTVNLLCINDYITEAVEDLLHPWSFEFSNNRASIFLSSTGSSQIDRRVRNARMLHAPAQADRPNQQWE